MVDSGGHVFIDSLIADRQPSIHGSIDPVLQYLGRCGETVHSHWVVSAHGFSLQLFQFQSSIFVFLHLFDVLGHQPGGGGHLLFGQSGCGGWHLYHLFQLATILVHQLLRRLVYYLFFHLASFQCILVDIRQASIVLKYGQLVAAFFLPARHIGDKVDQTRQALGLQI